jgi:serine/threonine-protein kinase PpkA
MDDSSHAFEIPGYRIERLLGQGGMACVYLATQESLGRQVSIKVMTPERAPSEDMIRRFEQETRVIAQLDHPHIVSIFEVGRTTDGHLYFSMPFLPHGDLSQRDLREDQAGIVAIVRALCEALAYAHVQGVVHRDVKPENVLFDKLDRPLLADFGIALTSQNTSRVTREGATLGSTGYMSPEQARGLALDGRSDLYSLGVMCYEMVSGELPFQGPDSLAVALAHVENPVPQLAPTRRHWQPLIDQAMAKQPAQRFQDAVEFLAALDRVQAHLDRREPVAAPPPPSTWSRYSWIGAASIGLALLLGLWAITRPRPAFDPLLPAPSTVQASTETAPAPIAALPVSAPSPLPDANALKTLLDEGDALLKQGKLLEPAGDNAAQRYLAILQQAPGDAAAQKGLQSVVTAMTSRVKKSVSDDDFAAARNGIEQTRLMLDQTPAQETALWPDFATDVGNVLRQRMTRAARAFDATALEALRGPIGALGAPLQGELQALIDHPLPTAGSPLRDNAGPALGFIPASKEVARAYALGTTEITRGDYDAFVRATHRAASSCRVPHQLLSRLRNIDWQDPGFKQTPNDPVVCVSWLDARAYTRWLSQRTGATYRLPTQAEWQHAAPGLGPTDACRNGNVADSSKSALLSLGDRYSCNDGYANTAPAGQFRANAFGLRDLLGNASEWTQDCSKTAPLEAQLKDNGCGERIFRGSSWRDGPNEAPASYQGASDPAVAYTTVGFRVLREVALDDLPKLEQRVARQEK